MSGGPAQRLAETYRLSQVAVREARRSQAIQVSTNSRQCLHHQRFVGDGRIDGIETSRQLDPLLQSDARGLIETPDRIEHPDGLPIRSVYGE